MAAPTLWQVAKRQWFGPPKKEKHGEDYLKIKKKLDGYRRDHQRTINKMKKYV